MSDAYGVLGLTEQATDEEILKAYKRLSRELHPDHGGDPEKMATLNEAYSLIKTPELRKKYFNGNEFTVKFKWMEQVFGKSDVAANFGKPPVDDRSQNRGDDINLTEEISLRDFIFGKQAHEIHYQKSSECLMCSGQGAAKVVNCPRCGATGKIVFRKKEKVCPKCHGSGHEMVGVCEICGGEGKIFKDCTFSFDITPGMTNLSVVGKGNDGFKGGPNGDLNIELNPIPDESRGLAAYMSNEGFPFISMTKQIHPEDFILGTNVDFDVYGRLFVVTVPPETYGFYYSQAVDDLLGTGVKAMVNIELAPEEPAEWLKKAYEGIRDARIAAKYSKKT